MPRTEARVFTSIWRDPDFLALEPSAQRLYLFLLSQDDLTYSGLIPLRPSRWAAKAAGLTRDSVERDLKALEAAPRVFAVTDEETGELLVRSLLRNDRAWKQPNLLKQAMESTDQLESPRIRTALLEELHRLPLDETSSEQVITLVGEFIQILEKGNAYPSAYPPGDPEPDPGPNPADDPAPNPSDDPSAKEYARARGLGGRNGSSTRTPNPPIPNSPSLPRRDRKLGTRLPDDFAVTAEMVTWFRERCPHVDGRAETEKFTDYWRGKPGKDGRKTDWVATWRNWMRTAEERAGPRARGTPSVPESTGAQRAQQALDAGQRVQAMLDGGNTP